MPDPAAVTACRYVWSWTSPAAKTPGMFVLVEPGSGEALARGIRELLAAPEKRRDMGIAARKRVESMFTWRRAAERRVEVYREAIAERVSAAC